MLLKIGKWIRGMKLERIFNKDTASQPQQGSIISSETSQPSKVDIGEGTGFDSIYKKAIEITEQVKNWVNNPIEDFLVHLLPKSIQNVEAKVQQYIPVILSGMLELKDPLALGETLKQVKFSTNFYWDKFWHDFAVSTATVLADGKIEFADLAVGIQFVHDHLFNKNEAG